MVTLAVDRAGSQVVSKLVTTMVTAIAMLFQFLGLRVWVFAGMRTTVFPLFDVTLITI